MDNSDPILLSVDCILSLLMSFYCVFLLDLLTGAVGLPLPGVEVRIAMNNTTNTTIVEGNQRETKVINTSQFLYRTMDEARSRCIIYFEFQTPNFTYLHMKMQTLTFLCLQVTFNLACLVVKYFHLNNILANINCTNVF